MELALKNMQGSTTGSIEVSDAVFDTPLNKALIHQVMVAQLANKRAGTHNTKTRSEVRGGGRKPWRQKGTGRARQGSTRSPQWRSGGITFGPKPRDYSQATPKKMRRAAIKSLLSQKVRDGEITVVEEFVLPALKTQAVLRALAELEITHMAHNLTSELSGGQSKLVDIGRAMMGDPDFLLLDEPVAGVAGPLAEKIFNNLRTIVTEKQVSVLVIEHNMDFILRRGVDRIIVMDQGKVLMQGTPDEVKDSKEVIEAYLGGAA